MMRLRLPIRSLFAIAASASLAACGSHVGFTPMTWQQSTTMSTEPFLAPPPCKGQTSTSNYATITETLLTTGGHLCIPEFAGLGGTLSYPSAHPSVKAMLTSSTKDYNGKMPPLHTGTPIFYLQIALNAGTTFGTNVPAGGGLTGAAIKAGQYYTLYGRATVSTVIGPITFNFTPCYALASAGPYGGVIGGLGTLLKSKNIPGPAKGFIEFYPGKSASGRC